MFIYKACGAVLAVLCLVLGILALVLSGRKPIVVVTSNDDHIYLQGEKKSIDISESDIRRFIEKYVKLYYEWPVLEPDKITQKLAPFVTDGFKSRALEFLKERKEKDFGGKSIRQDVSGLSVNVTKDSTIAIFDVVLRVDGIPLVVPTQMAFQLNKGAATEWNPIGLYVNSATVHEGK